MRSVNWCLSLALVALTASVASAQNVDASKIFLGASPCVFSQGTVAPSGGADCDVYVRKAGASSIIYQNVNGSWTPFTGTVTGSGTTGTLPKWASATSLGDSVLVQSGNSLTGPDNITIAQDLIWSSATGYGLLGSDSYRFISYIPATGMTFNPNGSIFVNPTGNAMNPTTGYDINLGTLQKKYLTLHAAELWVETLVAQNTIATIGGRILVGPTTTLTADLAATSGASTVTSGMLTQSGVNAWDAASAVDGNVATNGWHTDSASAGAYVHVDYGVGEAPIIARARLYASSTSPAVYRVDYSTDDSTWYELCTLPALSTAGWHSCYILTPDPAARYWRFYLTNTPGGGGYVTEMELLPAVTISSKYNNLTAGAAGSIVYLEADGSVEFMHVNEGPYGAGPYTYYVTRDLDGTGRNDWYAGDAVFNTGTTGNGFIDLYSVRGVKAATEVGPTIVGNVRTSATYNDWAPRWAIGNLTGLYGYTATGPASCGDLPCYGVVMGDYSGANLAVDATNGIRFRSSTSVLGQLSPTTWTLGYTGTEHVVISGTAVQIKDGATVYTDLTAGALSLGDTANEHVLLDTSGMAVKDGASVYAQFAATTTVGLTASEHVSVSSTAVQIKDGATVYTEIGAGAATFGQVAAGQSNVYIASGALSLRNNTTDRIVLAADGSGSLATNAISWTTAGVMSIGSWVVSTGYIKDIAGVVGLSSVVTAGDDIRFWAGDATPGSAEFTVTESGALTATNATLTGSLTAGGGVVTLDSDGMEITAGDDLVNKIKWSDGSAIYSGGTDDLMLAGNTVGVKIGTDYFMFSGSALYTENSSDLGTSTYKWTDLHLSHSVFFVPDTDDTANYPLTIASGEVVQKTDGLNTNSCGAGVDSITHEYGIAVAIGCTALSNSPAVLRAEITELRQQIAELRALLLNRQ